MTVATAFELEDIRAKLAERQANAVEAEADAVRSSYRYIRPLVDSADSLIDYVTNPEGRFLLGLHEIDLMTRGFARGELVMVTGRSHCFDDQTELLSDHGWVGPDSIRVGDRVWGVDASTGQSGWGHVLEVVDEEYNGPMLSMEGKNHSSLTTPGHRWFVTSQYDNTRSVPELKVKRSEELNTSDYLPLARQPKDTGGLFTDDEVALLGWVSTDGWFSSHGFGVNICQSITANLQKCAEIQGILGRLGVPYSVHDRPERGNQRVWAFSREWGRWVREQLPNKRLTVELLDQLTVSQRTQLVDVLIRADGSVVNQRGTRRLYTSHQDVADTYSVLLAQAGIAYSHVVREQSHEFGGYQCGGVQHVFTLGKRSHVRVARQKRTWVEYSGRVWCPRTTLGSVFARRGKTTYYSGNTGKSQVVLNAIANNRDSHIIYFSFDEPTELILAKLASITTGISGELIEEQIRSGDQETADLVRRVATHEFRNLVVIDDVLRLSECMKAIQEAEDYWGTPCDVAVFDYLELIPGGTGDQSSVVSTSQNLKKLIKDANVVGLVIHQSKTSGTPRGKPAGLESMRYGGTSEAIFVLETYRPCEDDDLPEWEALRLANFINVNLCKNKRPPSKKGDKSFFLHPETGRIREPRPEDLIVPGAPITDASVAARAHAGSRQ